MSNQATEQGHDQRPAPATVPERLETVIVGGGQAGLAVGYHLARRDRPFVILDANQRIGDAWRHRWDSLRLFTPARYDGLPGMPFPAPAFSYPSKDEVADYLEAYAARFDLPVRTGVRVDQLARNGDRYLVAAGDRQFQADHVVVASGAYQRPRIPAFAAELDPGILQLDPIRYRDPSQLPGGGVLVVGAGNSGAEIAYEVSRIRPTWLSGPDTGHIPVRSGSRWDRLIIPPFWWFASRVLTVQTPIGRKVRPKALTTTAPLERVRPKELAAAGVERVPRTVAARHGQPVLADRRVMDVSTIIWCTGFRPDFSWVDLSVFDPDGAPVHHRGVVASEPGLYFLGLWFLSAFTSSLLGGVGSDAEHIAEQITARRPDNRPPAEVLTAARRAGQLADLARANIAEQNPQDLDDRGVGQGTLADRHAAARQHPGPVGGATVGQFGDQAGLADAGLAPHQDDGRVGICGPPPGRLQGLELLDATNEGRARHAAAHLAGIIPRDRPEGNGGRKEPAPRDGEPASAGVGQVPNSGQPA